MVTTHSPIAAPSPATISLLDLLALSANGGPTGATSMLVENPDIRVTTSPDSVAAPRLHDKIDTLG